MSKTTWLSLVISLTLPVVRGNAQPVPDSINTASGQEITPGPIAVSPMVAEVIRLSESGVSEDVIQAYIQNSAGGFNLTADQILYVRDIGLSSQVISAMINRDATLREQPQTAQTQPETQPPPAPTPSVPVEAPLTPQDTLVSTPPPAVSTFYSDLAPYGTWVTLEGVGWCWQPRVVIVNRSWQPYCDAGHWVYSDAGWYWASDYSWGWAPFHYGRWYLHQRCGWVWTPDTVWGPAWVVWRSGGDRCGWAPLPPHAVFDVGFGWRYNGVRVRADFDFGLRPDCFTFVGIRDFNDRDLRHRRLARTEVTRIYRNTTIINNYTVNNKTIINRGIPVDRVAASAQIPVRHATVRDVPAGSARANLMARAGERDTTTVYRTQIRTPARSTPVTVQKVDQRSPAIQHTEKVAVTRQIRPGFENQSGRRAPSGNSGSLTPGRQTVDRPAFSVPSQPSPSRTTPSTSVNRQRESATRTEQVPRTFESPQRGAQPTAPARTTPEPRTAPPNRQQPAPQTGVFPSVQGRPRTAEIPSQQKSVERNSQPFTTPPENRGNAHSYYPKGYHQAEEIRPMPHSAPRQAPSSSSGRDSSSNTRSRRGD